ncbi:hypothetical protein GMJAKD_04290 [Candidatus Electrothrix aarhusensis]
MSLLEKEKFSAILYRLFRYLMIGTCCNDFAGYTYLDSLVAAD